MTWRVAKALLHLRDQVNARYPYRDKEDDGTIGDEAHASRTSDHNPWVQDGDGYGVVTAMDLTHDPAHGMDTYKFADQLREARDPRIKYIISNRRIANSHLGWSWRPYNGENPHDRHVHISVEPVRTRYDDTSDWKVPMLGAAPKPIPAPGPRPTKRQMSITATVFGGSDDPNTSAYDEHEITDTELGVSLPSHLIGKRPKVRVFGPRGSAVGEIVDVGPWYPSFRGPADPYWVTGARPRAETARGTNKAGIDLTPAMAHTVGIDGKGLVDWEFVE